MERNERLQRARRERGFAQASEAAAAFGWNRNTYISNENGNADFSFKKAKTYAQALGVRPEWLYDGAGAMRAGAAEDVPIIGYVGANPEGTVLFATGQVSGDSVPPPPNGSTTARALEVRGHSMPFFADDGSIIYFDNQRTAPSAEMLGHVVVAELDTDEVLVKRLLRGSEAGLYDLESIAGPRRQDAKLRWVAEIVAIVPPNAARQIIRRGAA